MGDEEQRYAIRCIHSAEPQYDEPKLVQQVSHKTPSEMHDLLAKPDKILTNAKDKERMLPIVGRTDQHIRELFARTRMPTLKSMLALKSTRSKSSADCAS